LIIMMKKTLVIAAAVLTIGAGAFAMRKAFAASECAGNACSSVSVAWTGSCYNVRNNDSSRNVTVSLKPAFSAVISVSRTLMPSETWVPRIEIGGGGCITGYESPYNANF